MMSMPRLPRALLILLALLVVLGGGRQGLAEPSDKSFLSGLRSRRLFSLADRFCRERLASNDLSAREEADLTVELIRIRAEQAVHARPDDRAAHWRAARQVAADFGNRRPPHPRGLLVRVQDALTPLARGQLARQESEVAADPQPLQDAARRDLREAVRLLEDIDKELVQAIVRAAGNRNDNTLLSSEELFSLQHHVQYQLGRAQRNRALCYAPGSENWLATLTAATEQLARPLSQLTPADSLWWTVRLEQIRCHRLLKEYAQADRLLREFLAAGPSVDARWAAVAEAARLRLALGRAEEGLSTLASTDSMAIAPADVDLARLECLLALWEAADKQNDKDKAQQWQRQAVRQVAVLEQQHGPFWGRRGELLLVRHGGRGAANLDVLERVAANFYRKGQLNEAIDAYEQAALRAAESQQTGVAFGFGYKAALIDQQRRMYADASRRFRQIALRWPRQADAGKAHLLAVWNMAQVARADPQRMDDYREILEEHLGSWPGGPSTAQAAQWLGSLHESGRRWREASAAYSQTPVGAPRSAAALRGAVRCWKSQLAQLRTNNRPYAREAQRATAWLEGWVLGSDGRLPERWSDAARLAALEAASLHLQYTAKGHARAEQLLRAGLQATPAAPDDWKAAAEGLLVVAIAGQPGRAAEARGLVTQLGGGKPEKLLEVLRGLDRIAGGAPGGASSEVAQLQLELVRQIDVNRAQLSAEAQTELDRVQARALGASRDKRLAAAPLRRLADNHPRDATIQLAYGRFLSRGEGRKELLAAAEQWRRIAAGSRKNSPRWWEAKYAVAESLLRAGDAQDAAQRIEYLLATAKFDSDERKGRFETLLRRCR